MCENIFFRKVVSKRLTVLPTQGRSCYFPYPLEIVLSIPLVGSYPHLLDVKGQSRVIVWSSKATDKDTLAIVLEGLSSFFS